ncbi:hypothetical protein TEA_017099 [Camellia sinensis var. sinensis]|uniref:KIB1-4 beta-propeller domain-containing protein n=1 Tax=Camellia sinensis var. sinensis TaxID=542762 RepID=A0A4S4D9S5_CAMSN|nr:hypothetical protein TEA_017099 [Camellia sinensis var. sinensis]
MRKWAELISDVLVLIAKRIDVVEDYVAFGGVCKSWQVAAVKENFNERGWSHQIPWLMLAQEEEEEERRFVSLRKGSMICKVMRLPEANGKRCMESLGWFVTISQDGQLNLLHPFSRVQIGLPPVTTLKWFRRSSPEHAGVSSAKTAIINGGNDWALAAVLLPPLKNGKFYGVDACCRVYECDVGGSNPTVARYVGGIRIPIQLVVYKRPYIVESAGGGTTHCPTRWICIDADKLDHDDDDYDNSGTCEFLVFRHNTSNGRWKKMRSLEDNHSLFLGHSASISIEVTSKFPGIKANYIYYTDDYAEQYWSFKRGRGKDMGIYN